MCVVIKFGGFRVATGVDHFSLAKLFRKNVIDVGSQKLNHRQKRGHKALGFELDN